MTTADVERLIAETRELVADDPDGEFPFPDGRATDLAERLTAPGPKACAVSASECHEITEYLFNAYDHDAFPAEARKALRTMADALHAQQREIERLSGLVDDWSTSSIANGTERDKLRHDLEIARADASKTRDAWSDRDAARAEVYRLTAALASADSVWSTTCEQQAQRIAQLERAMPRETSASIAQWQNETFGPATTTFDRIARSSRMIFAAMAKASSADLKVPRPNLSRAIRATEELSELIQMLVVDDKDPDAPVEVADIGIVLEGIPAAHGQETSHLKDEKMVINRARSWHVTGDGHGQHVAEEGANG